MDVSNDQTMVANSPPPKVKDAVKVNSVANFSDTKSLPNGVILEGESLKSHDEEIDEEDEGTNVKSDLILNPAEFEDGKKHGMLVRDLLQEQKKSVVVKSDLPEGAAAGADRTDGIKLGRIGGKERRSSYSQQMIDAVRNHIQKICQSVNPLGKCIDFVNEDLELMRLELEKWKQEQTIQQQKLDKEQRSTAESLVHLEKDLQRIDQQLLDARSQIRGRRGNILRNDEQLRILLERQTRSR